jgi:hypothetical protein
MSEQLRLALAEWAGVPADSPEIEQMALCLEALKEYGWGSVSVFMAGGRITGTGYQATFKSSAKLRREYERRSAANAQA